MKIIPAIDIKDGQCIRLRQGELGTESVYSDDPVTVAHRWESEGAELIHLVDLDGAFTGIPQNREIALKIIRSVKTPIQVSGGIRNLEDIKYYMDSGTDRLVLGTKVVSDPKFLESACEIYPGRISVGLDSRDGKVLVQGWTEATGQSAVDLAGRLGDLGVLSIIFTDVRRDGMLEGPNLEAIRQMAQATRIPIIASGGVSSMDDIRSLINLEPEGVTGIIIGKALYSGAIKLPEAIAFTRGHD